MKAKTFADMRKSLPGNKQKKLMVSTEVLFRRLLAVSRVQEIDLETVLKHELAAVPPALYNDDGSMRKTTIADLAKKIKAVCDEVRKLSPVASQPPNTVYITDGMAMPQGLNEALFKTFGDLVGEVLKKILRLLYDDNMGIGCVSVVFDRYDKTDSIKSVERERRDAGENTPGHQLTSSRDVPNYWLFLKGSANKVLLSKYACESITDKASGLLQQNKSIVLAGGFSDGQTVKYGTNSGMGVLPHLFSNHEEADTELFFVPLTSPQVIRGSWYAVMTLMSW